MVDSKSFVQKLISSLGLKRKLSALFLTLATLAAINPLLAPYAAVLGTIASWLGLTGVVHAGVKNNVYLDVHTVAAFFTSLILLVKEVPALKPYEGLITLLATVLSHLSVGAWLFK